VIVYSQFFFHQYLKFNLSFYFKITLKRKLKTFLEKPTRFSAKEIVGEKILSHLCFFSIASKNKLGAAS